MLGTLEQLALAGDDHDGDADVWYKPDGSLWRLDQVWYATWRVYEYVVEAVDPEHVFAQLAGRDGKYDERGKLLKGGKLARRWSAIRSGEQERVSVAVVDDLFTALGLTPCTVALGDPDDAGPRGGRGRVRHVPDSPRPLCACGSPVERAANRWRPKCGACRKNPDRLAVMA